MGFHTIIVEKKSLPDYGQTFGRFEVINTMVGSKQNDAFLAE